MRPPQMQLEEGMPLSLGGTRFALLAVLANEYTPTEKVMHFVEHQRKNPPVLTIRAIGDYRVGSTVEV